MRYVVMFIIKEYHHDDHDAHVLQSIASDYDIMVLLVFISLPSYDLLDTTLSLPSYLSHHIFIHLIFLIMVATRCIFVCCRRIE